MPWTIEGRDGKFCVVKDSDGSTVHCHETREKAEAQMRALWAGERRRGSMKCLDAGEVAEAEVAAFVVYDDGGAVKALDDDGRFGGYLARWGSPELPDATAQRDYFTPETRLGRLARGPIDVLYHHGLGEVKGELNPLGDAIIGEATIAPDGEGLWLEGALDRSIPGVADVWGALKADDSVFGLSSGAVTHLVRRDRQPNGTNRLTAWPIYEASLTPTPGEPRTAAVALKSLMEPPGDAVAATFVENALKTVSDLKAALDRFPKVGQAKLDAAKALRDALDEFCRRHEPKADPDRLRALDERAARFRQFIVEVGHR